MSENVAVAGAPFELAPLAQPALLMRLKRLRLNVVFVAGLALLVLVVLVALLAPLLTPYGPIDQNLAIESSCPQKSLVENFRPVGGGKKDNARAGIKSVEFCEQLVERLLLLVEAPERAGDTAASERVEFIDENDAWRRPPRLLKEITYARGTHANKHLDELRA